MVGIAGCATKEGGTPSSAATVGNTGTNTRPPGSGGSTPSGVNGAPKIDRPLDASRFLTQPCAVLSAAQLKVFNISKPGVPHIDDQVAKSSGPYCGWRTDDEPVFRAFDVGFITSNKHGLADTIRGGREAFPGYFEPTEVEGYPAVFNDLVDGRAGGACNITVGISDTLAFRAAEQADRVRGTRSCDGAKQFAAAVIKTLREQ